jgi:hypothetical protein
MPIVSGASTSIATVGRASFEVGLDGEVGLAGGNSVGFCGCADSGDGAIGDTVGGMDGLAAASFGAGRGGAGMAAGSSAGSAEGAGGVAVPLSTGGNDGAGSRLGSTGDLGAAGVSLPVDRCGVADSAIGRSSGPMAGWASASIKPMPRPPTPTISTQAEMRPTACPLGPDKERSAGRSDVFPPEIIRTPASERMRRPDPRQPAFPQKFRVVSARHRLDTSPRSWPSSFETLRSGRCPCEC